MRLLLALAPLTLAAAAAAQPLDCRFAAACIEAGLCTEIDRSARLLPGDGDAAVLEMEAGRLAGTVAPFGALRLFDGGNAELRLLLGIAEDGTARLMAMEAAPPAVAIWIGTCEEI